MGLKRLNRIGPGQNLALSQRIAPPHLQSQLVAPRGAGRNLRQQLTHLRGAWSSLMVNFQPMSKHQGLPGRTELLQGLHV